MVQIKRKISFKKDRDGEGIKRIIEILKNDIEHLQATTVGSFCKWYHVKIKITEGN